ncbi:MAG: lipocalin family protein [Reichenbachiella sp.]|uniref:lipocalin family protein n=1 Tax=Reichenbachiella sp. TaxID=2184521 RepID=UPI003266B35F
MKHQLSFLWACLFLLSACSVVVEESIDSSDPDVSTITFANEYPASSIDANTFLLGGSSRIWQTIAFTIEGVNGFQNCRLDDEIELREDGTYYYDGGEMLCGAEDNQKIKQGEWRLDEESRTLIFDEGAETQTEIYIESLTEEEMVISTHYYQWKVVGKFSHD